MSHRSLARQMPLRRGIAMGLLLLGLAALAGPAAAAAARTFVSAANGSDANAATNCGPTAPCRTFATAMSVTSAAGEVVVLTSGGYGPFTVTQSVTINAPVGVYAGIAVATGAGITINGSAISVTLKGLSINGTGGTYGIYLQSGASLTVRGMTISNFPGTTGGTSSAPTLVPAYGILVAAPADVKVLDTTIRDSFNAIWISTGAHAVIEHTRLLGTINPNSTIGGSGFAAAAPYSIYNGIMTFNDDATSTTTATVRDCYADDGVYEAYVAQSIVAGGTAKIYVDHSTSSGGFLGVVALGNGTTPGTVFAAVTDSLFSLNGYASIYDSGPTTALEMSGNTINYAAQWAVYPGSTTFTYYNNAASNTNASVQGVSGITQVVLK